MRIITNNQRKKRRGSSARKGVALLLTLLVVGLLSASVVTFIRMAHLEAKVADNVYSYNQGEIMAQAGLKGAMMVLAMDDQDYDAFDEYWAKFDQYGPMAAGLFDEGTFTGTIIDLNSRFNVNRLLDGNGLLDVDRIDHFERLLTLAEFDPGIIDAVIDWLDADDDSRPGGAEDSWYLSQDEPFPCPNGPFTAIGQLALVKGIGYDVLYGKDDKPGLKELITVNSDGFININTASEKVLMCLDEEMTETIVQEIIKRRKERPFEKLDELKDISGITPQLLARITGFISVKSSDFLVIIQGRFRDAIVPASAVIHRTGKGAQLVYYRLG